MEAENSLEKIVKNQFEQNLEMLKQKLQSKPGLVTSLLVLVETGRLEEVFLRQSAGGAEAAPQTFPPASKYVKQAGVTWLREFLISVNPSGFKVKDDANDDEKKLAKLAPDKATDIVCIALHCMPDCWLFHRETEVAMQKALHRYNQLGPRIAHMSYRDELARKGFYTQEGMRIVAKAMGCDLQGEQYFVDSPIQTPVEWQFKNNTSAMATLIGPNGDAFQLLSRFQEKYPYAFRQEAAQPVLSIEPGGVSPHPSLGDVRRSAKAKAKAPSGSSARVHTLAHNEAPPSLDSLAVAVLPSVAEAVGAANTTAEGVLPPSASAPSAPPPGAGGVGMVEPPTGDA